MILSLEISTVHRVGLGWWFVCVLWRFDQPCSAALGRLSSQSTALCGKWRSNSNPMELHYTLGQISRTLSSYCMLSWVLWRLHGEWLRHKAIDERSVATGATHAARKVCTLSCTSKNNEMSSTVRLFHMWTYSKWYWLPRESAQEVQRKRQSSLSVTERVAWTQNM